MDERQHQPNVRTQRAGSALASTVDVSPPLCTLASRLARLDQKCRQAATKQRVSHTKLQRRRNIIDCGPAGGPNRLYMGPDDTIVALYGRVRSFSSSAAFAR